MVNLVARETGHEIGQLRRSAGTMVSVTVQARVNSAEQEVRCEMRDAGSCSVAFELLSSSSSSSIKKLRQADLCQESWKPKLTEELSAGSRE